MMNAWLPLVAGLVGTIIGGVIAYVNAAVQWRRQQRTERNRHLLAKLEQLCNVVIEVESRLQATWAETMARINGWPQPKGTPENRKPIPLDQMHLLTALYFESLVPHAAAVIKGRDDLGEFVVKSLSPPKEQTQRQQLSTAATEAHTAAEVACKEFLAEAARTAKTLL